MVLIIVTIDHINALLALELPITIESYDTMDSIYSQVILTAQTADKAAPTSILKDQKTISAGLVPHIEIFDMEVAI